MAIDDSLSEVRWSSMEMFEGLAYLIVKSYEAWKEWMVSEEVDIDLSEARSNLPAIEKAIATVKRELDYIEEYAHQRGSEQDGSRKQIQPSDPRWTAIKELADQADHDVIDTLDIAAIQLRDGYAHVTYQYGVTVLATSIGNNLPYAEVAPPSGSGPGKSGAGKT